MELEDYAVRALVPLVGIRPLANTLPVDGLSFWDVLDSRRSRRVFGNVSSQQLSTFLWRAARTKEISIEHSGFAREHRPYPSAGGRHPVELLVHGPSLGLVGLSVYDPIGHCLLDLDLEQVSLNRFLNRIEGVLPLQEGVLVWMAVDPARTASKYCRPDSLIWRDVGVALGTCGLVAEALALHSCAVGITAEAEWRRLFPADLSLHTVGGLIIGSPVELGGSRDNWDW